MSARAYDIPVVELTPARLAVYAQFERISRLIAEGAPRAVIDGALRSLATLVKHR